MPAKNFRRDIEVFISDNLSPQARSKALANFARQQRDTLIQSGDASRNYVTYVDGRIDPNEDDVRGDGSGIISYNFSLLVEAAQFAMAFLQTRTPKVTGKLSESFWMSIDDNYIPPGVSIDFKAIKPSSKIVIGNIESYWRKADINSRGSKTLHYHAPNILDDCVTALLRQYGRSAISAVRKNDYNFPAKYSPVRSPNRAFYVYQSPVIVITEIS